jgi:signal transduction histidine kinase/ActR/RegA family two-component response regulator
MNLRWRLYRSAERPRGAYTALALVTVYIAFVVLTQLLCKDRMDNTPFWPANGVLVAGILLLSRRIGSLLVAGCLALNIAGGAIIHLEMVHVIFYSFLHLALCYSVAFFTRAFCGAAIDLSRPRRLLAFSLIAIAAATVETTLGQALRVIFEPLKFDVFSDWRQWVHEDALGLIVATPAVLLILKRDRSIYAGAGSVLEYCLLAVLTVAITATSLLSGQFAGLLLVYPLLVWMAFRSGPPWVAGSVMAIALTAAMLTAHGYGPFVVFARGDEVSEQYMVQIFIVSVFVCAVPATMALAERNRTSQTLRRIHAIAREARLAAERASYAKSQFVANMSHEIRTPLNGVLGMTQAMAKDDLSEIQRERLDVVQRSGEILLTILNDILDFSKIEAGKLTLEISPFDLEELAQGAHAAFTAVAQKKGLSFDLRVEASACAIFNGDATRVRQIIYNLVSNALKFTEDGHVRVLVKGLDVGFSIQVADTGIGISDDNLKRLFSKFEQADASTTRRFGGTGLGLAICRELTVLMGGRIDVRSVVGEGSTFIVDLPLERLPNDAAAPSADPVPDLVAADDVAERPVRLLAAEDNRVNQLVLKTLLHQAGIYPVLVDDGRAAVEAWASEAWDIVLMDMQMPVMDGLTATRMIREQERLTGRPRTPIVALTANAMSHHLADYRAAGIDAFVSKPIDIGKLIEAIGLALSGASDGEAPPAIAAQV